VALRTGAAIVCGFDTAALMREAGVPDAHLRVVTSGIRAAFGDILVRPVASLHWSQAVLADGSVVSGVPMGFVVEVEPGVRVYHFGDSALSAEMALIGRVHRPDVGLLGVSQPWSLVAEGAGRVVSGEMSPQEAAVAAELLGVRYAVATHYEDPDAAEVAEFLAAVEAGSSQTGRIGLALRPEETLVLDGPSHQIEAA
jgi:L-ascorbate metabolism protein UlaG (beta-lactamase superfamily)